MEHIKENGMELKEKQKRYSEYIKDLNSENLLNEYVECIIAKSYSRNPVSKFNVWRLKHIKSQILMIMNK